jgi:hypothetical protein
MPDSFEIFLNENTADLQVFRITLTMFILHLVGADPPTVRAKLESLKNSVMGAIGRIETDPQVPGSERMKQMIAMRAEKFSLRERGDGLAYGNDVGLGRLIFVGIVVAIHGRHDPAQPALAFG